jgi:hypothetical protein
VKQREGSNVIKQNLRLNTFKRWFKQRKQRKQRDLRKKI